MRTTASESGLRSLASGLDKDKGRSKGKGGIEVWVALLGFGQLFWGGKVLESCLQWEVTSIFVI